MSEWTSADGTVWRDVPVKTDGKGGSETHAVMGTGRYVRDVRMQGTARGTAYG